MEGQSHKPIHMGISWVIIWGMTTRVPLRAPRRARTGTVERELSSQDSITKCGFLVRPHAQIVALRAHYVRAALKGPPNGQDLCGS